MHKLKIAIISDWYSEGMGYSENCLPKVLAKLGHEVHLITSNKQIYFNRKDYKDIYESFLGNSTVKCEIKEIDGYTIHRLPYGSLGNNHIYIKNIISKLSLLRPDIVQTFDLTNISTIQAAMIVNKLNFKLFIETHRHASVISKQTNMSSLRYKLIWPFSNSLIGKFISSKAKICYAISSDAADIAIKYYGINKEKLKIISLGVDTDLFRPIKYANDECIRTKYRKDLGFTENNIVCIYTGRFSEDKNPQCLAKAIDYLVDKSKEYRGLFIGNGSDEETANIKNSKGCIVKPFIRMNDLFKYYWASDIAVWPKQESTSQLDAVACALPIILSNKVKVIERVSGNGLLYEENNYIDLANKINSLNDINYRKILGNLGSKKISESYSWDEIANKRVTDYYQYLLDAKVKI